MKNKGYRTVLSEIAIVTQGQSPKSVYYSTSEGVPFLQGNRTFGELYPKIDTYTKQITRLAQKGDVLMSVRAPVGDLNIAPCDLCIGRGLATLRSKTCDNAFIYYALKYNVPNLLKQGSATTFDSVNKDIINSFEIIIPKDETTRIKVSTFMYDLDSKIHINNQVIEQLNRIEEKLFNYWFLQFNYKNEKGQPYCESGGLMSFSKDIGISKPSSWETIPLGSYITIERGISYKSDDLDGNGIPLINLNTFNTDSTYKISGLKSFSGKYSQSKILEPYSLLVCVTQQTSIDLVNNSDVIGKSFLLPDIFETDVVASMDVIKINVKNGLNNFYLNQLFKTSFYHKYISGFANGTKIKHLDIEGILNFPVVIPDLSVLNEFTSIIKPFEEIKSQVIRENSKLANLRDWLLPMLMNGQVTIND